jgi:hypothetical protein
MPFAAKASVTLAEWPPVFAPAFHIVVCSCQNFGNTGLERENAESLT